jgi:uncharacterized protein (DUF697 family)
MDDIMIYLIISFVSTIIGSIIASIALMRYLTSIGALDYDVINKHRQEVRKRAGKKKTKE